MAAPSSLRSPRRWRSKQRRRGTQWSDLGVVSMEAHSTSSSYRSPHAASSVASLSPRRRLQLLREGAISEGVGVDLRSVRAPVAGGTHAGEGVRGRRYRCRCRLDRRCGGDGRSSEGAWGEAGAWSMDARFLGREPSTAQAWDCGRGRAGNAGTGRPRD
jgi:hypothetical protein